VQPSAFSLSSDDITSALKNTQPLRLLLVKKSVVCLQSALLQTRAANSIHSVAYYSGYNEYLVFQTSKKVLPSNYMDNGTLCTDVFLIHKV